MSVRLNLVLSDELNDEIELVADASETNKSVILRKALQLYLAAQDGKKEGLKLGLVDPDSKQLKIEIIGL